MPRTALLIQAALLALVACASSGYPPAVPAYEIRDRIRDVSIGQSLEVVHEIVGSDAVKRPNHPEAPIPSPINVLQIDAAEGRRIRVEVYVIDVWRAEGCPDFHYRDVPISFIDGVVISREWRYLEWNWEKWGGSLADLRTAQDRLRCDDDAVQPSSSEGKGSTSSVSPRDPTTRTAEPAATGPFSPLTSAFHNSDPTAT